MNCCSLPRERGKELSEVIEPRRTGLPSPAVSGFRWWGWPSGVSLADHLACCPYWSESRLFLVAHHLSVEMDFSLRVSGRVAGHVGRYHGWCLLLPFGPY